MLCDGAAVSHNWPQIASDHTISYELSKSFVWLFKSTGKLLTLLESKFHVLGKHAVLQIFRYP